MVSISHYLISVGLFLWCCVLMSQWLFNVSSFLCPSSAFGAVLQGSLFGLAGILPASYTTPIMSGQGLAGAFAAFSMICALASMCHTQSTSAPPLLRE